MMRAERNAAKVEARSVYQGRPGSARELRRAGQVVGDSAASEAGGAHSQAGKQLENSCWNLREVKAGLNRLHILYATKV